MHFAESFASSLRRNDVVALVGELGSGKTQFVKGVCRHFRVPESVSSPTFVMLHRYTGRDGRGEEMLIYHFDLYKTDASSGIFDLGYEEFFHADALSLIEWGDRLRELAPRDRIEVSFSFGAAENERSIRIDRRAAERSNGSPDRVRQSEIRNEHSGY